MFAVLYFNSAYTAHLPSGYIPQKSGDFFEFQNNSSPRH